MEKDFAFMKAEFIKNYNLARPVMSVLGDEVRQEILLTLIEAGGLGGIRVGDIQKRSHVSRSAVSHHLKVLLDAGIICMRSDGFMVKVAAKKMKAACEQKKKNELFI